MKAELTQKLYMKYPKIFSKTERSTRDNLMYFGFDHDDGWYWLIDNLCETIQGYIDSNNKPQLIAVQVKEKFGRLRFYVENSDELIDGMIWFSENLSGTICEVCGTTKDVGKTFCWIKTICKDCLQSNERLKDREWKQIHG